MIFVAFFCCCFYSSYKHEPVVINTTPRGSSPRPSNMFLADRLRSSMNQTIEMGNMLAEDKFKDENIPLKPSISVASL